MRMRRSPRISGLLIEDHKPRVDELGRWLVGEANHGRLEAHDNDVCNFDRVAMGD